MTLPATIGKYQIEAELGRGGFAVVYRAFDPILQRRVALKTPHAPLVDNQTTDRFLREARLAAGLNHRNIITIYEVGDAQGMPYIAMELLEGATLHEWLHDPRHTPVAALKALVGVGAALDYAHQRGIIHRDVKPGNILVVPGRGAVLTDFGIAHALEQTTHSQSAVLGTPAYIAPEQVTGKPITSATDVYAFGVMLYQILAGRLPFTAPSPAVVASQHASATPPDPRQIKPSLPAEVAALLLQALAKEPGQRPASAEKLVRDLIMVLGGETAAAYMSRSRPLPAALIVTGALIVMLLVWAAIQMVPGDGSSPASAIGSQVTPTPDSPLSPLATQVPAHTGGSNLFIEYILDASGSMLESLGESAKLEIAREVLAEHMLQQPIDTNLGLRVYGHRIPFADTRASCQDVELIAPVVRGQGERIADWLGSMQAQGMSPIGLALRQAAADFIMAPERDNRVMLVSDGKETCGIDPCKEVEALRAQGLNFTVNVIGLNLNDEARTQLTCVTEKSGGVYRDAKTPADLANGLVEGTQPSIPSEPTLTPTIPDDATSMPQVTTMPVVITDTPTKPPLPTLTPTPTLTKAPQTPVVVVTPSVLDLRAGPGSNFPVVGRATGGSTLRVISSAFEQTKTGKRIWYEVCCATNGAQGWVPGASVSAPPTVIATTTRYPPTPTATKTPTRLAPTFTPTLPPINTPEPTPADTPEPPPTKVPPPTPET